jgi:DNA-directed RNA polymerase sigma subunit (sigma70/sigma32)
MNERLSAEDERRLITLAQAGDSAAETELVIAHLPPAFAIVNRYVGCTEAPQEDLEQEAALALVLAVRKFDTGRDVRFITYAMWWVRARVQRASQRWYHLSQEPPVTNARWIETMPEDKPPPPVGVDLRFLRGLRPRSRAAVELVLGLNGHRPHTQVQMAAVLGIRLAAANKLYLRALARLRRRLGRRAISPRLAA